METQLSIDWTQVAAEDVACLEMAMDVTNGLCQHTSTGAGAGLEADEAPPERQTEVEDQLFHRHQSFMEELEWLASANDDAPIPEASFENCEYEDENAGEWELGQEGDGEGEDDGEFSGFDRTHSYEAGYESFGDDEWRVEKILKRRKARPDELGEEVHDPEYEKDCQTVGQWMLLVQWEGYPEPTWERRAWLLDQGFTNEVYAFDESQKPQKAKEWQKPTDWSPKDRITHTSAKHARTAPSSGYQCRPYQQPGTAATGKTTEQVQAEQEAARRKRELIEKIRREERSLWSRFASEFESVIMGGAPNVATLLSAMRFPATNDFWSGKSFSKKPSEETGTKSPAMRLLSWFKEDHIQVTHVCPVYNPQTVERFYNRYVESAEGTPVISLCHGTRREYAQAIAERGLRVPGEAGVSVVNGSALGVGIYSTLSPNFASGYSHGSGVVFICAGMCMKIPEINASSGHIYVYYRSEYIVPILAVRVQRRGWQQDEVEQLRNPPPRVYANLQDMLNAPAGPMCAADLEDGSPGGAKSTKQQAKGGVYRNPVKPR